MSQPYDAFLLVSFGGPEGPDDVIPFLENVLRGKNVPRARMLEVAEHYRAFGGISPINQQCRDLIQAIQQEFNEQRIDLPIYWGNRNWHPLLVDTLQQMKADGRRRALAFFTSIFSSYSGCRQYRENIAAAQTAVGEGAPVVEKLRMPFNHPGFIAPQQEILRHALRAIDPSQWSATRILFSAHSIPLTMASRCQYENQLREAARLITAITAPEKASSEITWEVVYQSRSGPPHQPWLEPDVCDRIRELHAAEHIQHIVLQPLGFISDHIEVLYDLDVEAADTCRELGIQLIRTPTVGTHPRFVKMISELVMERLSGTPTRPTLGNLPACLDTCGIDCCLPS